MTAGDITSPDGEPTLRAVNGEPAEVFTPTDWQARLNAALEQAGRKKAQRRNERADLARARNHGLRQRHAEKLNRITHNGSQQ